MLNLLINILNYQFKYDLSYYFMFFNHKLNYHSINVSLKQIPINLYSV